MRCVNLMLSVGFAAVLLAGCGKGGNTVVEPPEEYQPTAQEVAEVERMMDAREQEMRDQGRR